jgi:hypothetical protein
MPAILYISPVPYKKTDTIQVQCSKPLIDGVPSDRHCRKYRQATRTWATYIRIKSSQSSKIQLAFILTSSSWCSKWMFSKKVSYKNCVCILTSQSAFYPHGSFLIFLSLHYSVNPIKYEVSYDVRQLVIRLSSKYVIQHCFFKSF